MEESSRVDSFAQPLFEKIVQLTKAANKLPIGEDYAYYKSFPQYQSEIQSLQRSVGRLLQTTLLYHKEDDLATPSDPLEDDPFDTLIDVVDGMDTFVDTLKGERKKPQIVISKAAAGDREYNVFHASGIARPQQHFADPVDNSNRPWEPKLPPGMVWEGSHPFADVIANLRYTPAQLQQVTPETPGPMGPPVWVDTPAALQRMVNALLQAPAVALDLEHHAYRSFEGFTCLLQLSDRQTDYLVDALALRSYLGAALHPLLGNPHIVKVLHGCDSDVMWLQRDFGLYLVNVFDTGQAARLLEFPRFSLSYLLFHFCGLEVDKQFQLADWRIRPLPLEMQRYAQSDTHWLLYLWDVLRNQLAERSNERHNLVVAVYQRSHALCLRLYEKPLFTPTSHLLLYNRLNLNFNPTQMRAFRDLYAWRDRVAREEDESERYVLPAHMLSRLAEQLPSDGMALRQCCAPLVPPLVRAHATDLLQLLKLAQEPQQTQQTQQVQQVQQTPQTPTSQSNLQSHLNAHEFTHESRRDPSGSPVLNSEQLYRTAGWVEESFAEPLKLRTESVVGFADSSLTSSLAGQLFDSDESDSDDDARQTAERIHAELIGFSFPNETSFLGHETSQPTESDKKAKKEKKEKTSQQVPQSMSEIYKLSNQIKRKRNKERKKLKEGIKANAEEESSEDEGERSKRPKGPKKESIFAAAVGAVGGTPAEFMQTIGWLDSAADAPIPVDRSDKDNSKSRGKNPKYFRHKNFTPHEYSRAPNATGKGHEKRSHEKQTNEKHEKHSASSNRFKTNNYVPKNFKKRN